MAEQTLRPDLQRRAVLAGIAVLGLALVVIGVCMVWVPAGLVVAGVGLLEAVRRLWA